MRSSKKVIVFGSLIFIILIIFINTVLDYLLIPEAYVRVDVNNIETKEYDDIFIGTSHGFCGIDPLVVDSITGEKSTNLCLGGEYLIDSYYLAKEVCRKHVPKKIIYEVDYQYWFAESGEDLDYARTCMEFPWSPVKVEYFLAKIAKADFRMTLFPWFNYRNQFNRISKTIKQKQTKEYKDYSVKLFNSHGQELKEEGFLYKHEQKDAKKKPVDVGGFVKENLVKETDKYFKKLVKLCKDNNIDLTVITLPVPQEKQQSFPDYYEQANKYFSDYMSEQGVRYYNFNFIKLDGFDRSINAFADYDGHMYGKTAEIFSKILAEYIKGK